MNSSTPTSFWPWRIQHKEDLPRGQSQRVLREVDVGDPPEEENLPSRLSDEPVKELSVIE